MINAAELTAELKALVVRVENDLRQRADAVPEVATVVSGEFVKAREAGRTALSEKAWRETLLTQVAVGWVLGAVFVRFCEDNGLISDPSISGPGERRKLAEDAQTVFLRGGDALGERDYLQHVFDQAAGLPGLDQVLGAHNPFRMFGPSEDGARDILSVFRAADEESGALVWDFTDAEWGTRFLGDLYQDLSEAAKKNFALLQTPDFVESFILDRTLDPAVDEFGLVGFRMIDPACGSGHFLLGAFDRLFARWQTKAPGDGARANAAKALEAVNGVDINPFAAAIAKFRLLVAALKVSGISRLGDAPVFALNVATGDSLLHAPVSKAGQGELGSVGAEVDLQGPAAHLFATEDGELVREILGRDYHAVVANPPYITPKDAAANAAYRSRFSYCAGRYSLAIPFMELIFRLAKRGNAELSSGFTGQITANSFMKREFGKLLVEDYLTDRVDLTHVVDTTGAYIPGHSTPTIILLGRNRPPLTASVRAVLGIRGEPSEPGVPADGLVWNAILAVIDRPGSETNFVSAADLVRSTLSTHPWSLKGGGASELLAHLQAIDSSDLEANNADVGYPFITGEDEAFYNSDDAAARRFRLTGDLTRVVTGADVRSWIAEPSHSLLFFSDPQSPAAPALGSGRRLWPLRRVLESGVFFGKTKEERGLRWYDYAVVVRARAAALAGAIVFPNVATSNEFAVLPTGVWPKTKAPVVTFASPAASKTQQLLGLLNSSVASFWMKQIFHDKGNGGYGGGIASTEWERFYEFDSTKLKRFPVAAGSVLGWAQRLDSLASELSGLLPLADELAPESGRWVERRDAALTIRGAMHGVQEELDWRCYHLYGLTEDDLALTAEEAPSLALGERAFEIVLARKMAAGEVKSTWFERHGSTPITELPDHWSVEYRDLVERRIALIEADRNVRLCEQPEHKRRWNWDDWADLEESALESWLLTRLEETAIWSGNEVLSVAQLADKVRVDAEFVVAAQMYVGATDVDLVDLISKLAAEDAVPFLAAWRYKPSGLRKRVEWESTWDLQRREDAGEDVGEIPVPPKYGSSDFRKPAYWKLRGKLDVPKERFVLYPGAERASDQTLVLGWAGWDHLEQAQALAQLIRQRQSDEGWGVEELTPLLAGLDELMPWLVQWHNDVDPDTGQRLGDFYDNYLTRLCAQLGLDRSALKTWEPPASTRGRKKEGNDVTSPEPRATP